MESFVPLIKAIIISSITTFCVTTVTITEQYIIRVEKCDVPLQENSSSQFFEVYDLNNEMILRKYANRLAWDTILTSEITPIEIKERESRNHWKVLSEKRHKEYFQGFKCIVIERDMERPTYLVDGPPIIQYKEVRYYAKIPLLDLALNTFVKKSVAGFSETPDDRYPYLISQYTEFNGSPSKNDLLRIVEQTAIEQTLLQDLIEGRVDK